MGRARFVFSAHLVRGDDLERTTQLANEAAEAAVAGVEHVRGVPVVVHAALDLDESLRRRRVGRGVQALSYTWQASVGGVLTVMVSSLMAS